MLFSWIIKALKKAKMLPKISATERAALEAGSVWIEGDLYCGRPDFKKIMEESYPQLNEEEKAFLDGPVEEVCNMINIWDVRQTRSLPKEVWDFLGEHKFFGLLVPKEYGGLGFREIAFSAVMGKLGTHSMTLNTVVLIPNSIGPSELILHFGTEEQKQYYLPRLSRGDEIPCFALTEPNAGSDAASMTSTGELYKDDNGELQIRLNWDKRYITLAPIATLLGLAFKLRDPENLLGKGEDLGITCALVPTDLPGVTVGLRHDPMGVSFPNGPTQGENVVIPAKNIIGGTEYAGRGWQMLMEALSGGRAISLPASAASGAKAVARTSGAYASLRQQFGMSIGNFEGIQEALARIGGKTYLVEAGRIFTCGAVTTGKKPSVASAIIKYQSTELARQILTDGMDVLGGKALCQGPKNPFSDAHAGLPIGITVEGANILTRTLITFGQGALRCHPYMQHEVAALEAEDAAKFRNALFGHAFFVMWNSIKLVFNYITRGYFNSRAGVAPEMGRYAQKIKWASTTYAVLAEMCVGLNGPALKQRGQLAGRFADALSWMYLASATIRRYEAEGRKIEDYPFAEWALQHSLDQIQLNFEGITQNMRMPLLGGFLGGIGEVLLRVFGTKFLRLNRLAAAPSDRLNSVIAKLMQVPGEQRERLTSGIFIPADETQEVALIEKAFNATFKTAEANKKVRRALRKKEIEGAGLIDALDNAVKAELITAEQADQIREAEKLRAEVLAVDSFTEEEYFKTATVKGEAILAARATSKPAAETETTESEADAKAEEKPEAEEAKAEATETEAEKTEEEEVGASA